MQNDYFAEGLLAKLDASDPVISTYEAQVDSRKVGFDFDNFADVAPRALDEVRETREARAEADDPSIEDGREHYGDEIADLMFSAVNLARHGGISVAELPALVELEGRPEAQVQGGEDVEELVSIVEDSIVGLVELDQSKSPDFADALRREYVTQMTTAMRLARSEGFEPGDLLKENVRKYLSRCRTMEMVAERDGKQWADLHAANEIVAYWKKAKMIECGQATLETV